MTDLAQDQRLYPTLVYISILQAKTHLTDNEIVKAREALDKCMKLAQDKQMISLETKIRQEQENLEKLILRWKSLHMENLPFIEKLEATELDNYIKQATRFVAKNRG